MVVEFQLTTQQQALVDQAKAIRTQADDFIVDSFESQKEAVSFLGKVASVKKELDTHRREYVDPLNHEVKRVNDAFRNFSQPILDADRIVRNKVSVYQIELEKKANEERKKAMAEAETQSFWEDEVQPVVLPEEPKTTVRTESGSSYMRRVWDFEIVDETLVPVQYKVVDEKRIRAAVASGLREIPGVRIFQRAGLAVRGS